MQTKLLEKEEKILLEQMNASKPVSQSHSILEISFSQEKERVQEDIRRNQNNVLGDLNKDEDNNTMNNHMTSQNNFKSNTFIRETESGRDKDLLNDSFEKYEIQ